MKKLKKNIIVSQFGRRNDFLVANIFEKNGLLKNLITTYWHKKIEKFNLLKKLTENYWFNSRYYSSDFIKEEKVITFPIAEVLSKIITKIYGERLKDPNYQLPFIFKFFNYMVSKKIKDFDGILYSLADSDPLFKNCSKAIKVHEHVNSAIAYKSALKELGWDKKELKNYERGSASEYSSLSSSDYIISPSKWISECIQKYYSISSKKIFIIPYWIPDWCTRNWEQRVFKKGEKLKIVFVGRVHKIKGIHLLIEAVKNFPDEIELYIVGACSDKKIIKDLPHNIKYIGYINRENLKNFYSKIHLFCLPSLCEGSALVSYEAIGFGLPGLVTYETGSQYKNNFTGIIVESNSISSIVVELKKILDDREKIFKWSKNTLKLKKEFNKEKYESRLIDTINKIKTTHSK